MYEDERPAPLTVVELCDATDPSLFGGKAYGLSRLIKAGGMVPAGFAISATTSVPDVWVRRDHEFVAARATTLLEAGPVAVRSSAIGEDASDHSFAGLFESVLGATDIVDVFVAAERCIESRLTPRVLAYAACGVGPMGVVVQSQIRPRVAGVCFTIDPAGKDTAQVIEAVAGFGDHLVSGHAQPQRWRSYHSAMGRWELFRDDSPSQPLLDRESLVRISTEAARFADQLGHPLDLEWAMDEAGVVWWLQARPVTAPATPPRVHIDRTVAGVDDGAITVWANWNLRETLPDPLMPLTWSVWRDVIVPRLVRGTVGIPQSSPAFQHFFMLDLVHGRVYLNMNALLAWPFVGALLKSSLFKALDPEAAQICRTLVADGVLKPRCLPGSHAKRWRRAITAATTNARRWMDALRPRRAMRSLQRIEQAMLRRQSDLPLTSFNERELYEEMHLLNRPDFAAALDSVHSTIVSMVVYHLAVRTFRGHPHAARLLATGIPENPTTQISLAIDEMIHTARPIAARFESAPPAQLVAALRQLPEGRAWLEQMADFLARFGHRGPKEFDLGAARWSENPDMIIELVRAGLATQGDGRLIDRMQRLAFERQAAVAIAVHEAPTWRRPLLRWMALLVGLHMPLREAPKHYVMLIFHRMRQAALELGDRFTRLGMIERPEDIFFLELPEVLLIIDQKDTSTDWRRHVIERRDRFEHFGAETVPNYLRSDGVPVPTRAVGTLGDANGTLRGTGISTGCARGPVRILMTPDPRAMADGDIIVMRFADPGWTPLFPRAAAVITEVGGLMCHAAVVARELGIPSVFGVVAATSLLANGQMVLVDGTAGTVTTEGASQTDCADVDALTLLEQNAWQGD